MASVPSVATIAEPEDGNEKGIASAHHARPAADHEDDEDRAFRCAASHSTETKALMATIAPTERSICRAMMTSACPTATMHTSVAESAT